MEYIKSNPPPSYQQRVAPAPFLISVGMGLVAPIMMRVMDNVVAVDFTETVLFEAPQ